LVAGSEPALDVGTSPYDFGGLLFENAPATDGGGEDRSSAPDLNLDQVVNSIVQGVEEPEFLSSLFYRPLHDVDSVRYRQEVFQDLEDRGLFRSLAGFSNRLRRVRAHLHQLEKMRVRHQREGWLLDAAATYCDALRLLADDLARAELSSRGLTAFRNYLEGYVGSAGFSRLDADTTTQQKVLSSLRYCIRIRGSRVDVTRYDGEADYSEEVLKTFERFQQGAVADYRVTYRMWPGINHVTAQILQLVARLFAEEFSALDEYCRHHAAFLDETVRRFERELRFYLAYLGHIEPMRSSGLPFCYPEVSGSSKAVSADETFDLALAAKLVSEGAPVVTNDFTLDGPERILVVTGPNQGGKTTFARTFGQLHHLASLGCPVPGSACRLFLFDRLFTLFEREEDLARMSGKLEDDIVRAGQVLRAATPRSIIILNEPFTSTTLADARFLGAKLLETVMRLDALCVYVTFVDELASMGGSVVSMMSTVVPDDPVQRTFKVVRRPADGLAFALAIAEKHDVTYERLRTRLHR
jgi:DNA mismatch repair protein MutS